MQHSATAPRTKSVRYYDPRLAAYRANGLNGPRAMARRARQWDKIEARKQMEAA